MSLHRTTTDSYFEDVIAESAARPVLVKFTASWCGPCKALTPVLEKMDDEYSGLAIVEIDIEDDVKLAEDAGVSSVPTMIVYVDGEEQKRIMGAKPKPALEHELAAFLG